MDKDAHFCSWAWQCLGDDQGKGFDFQEILNRIEFINLQEKLDLKFSLDILYAFIHRSFVNEFNASPSKSYQTFSVRSYERLEFLGDSFLNLLITEQLYKRYPNSSEGELSKLRGALVNGKIFSTLAYELGLHRCVLLGKGELNNEGYLKEAILSDVFEAFIGALYIGQGLDIATRSFQRILSLYEEQTGEIFYDLERLNGFDYKTKFQEICLSRFKVLPEYRAKMTDKGFHVTCLIKQRTLAETTHISKKTAQEVLAKKILNSNLLEEIQHVI
ncbi:MAG: ribonuclease III [Bacteriovoracaceae bacterium]